MTDDRAAAEAWISSLEDPRSSQIRHLHEVITTAIPDADVTMFDYGGPLIGYGTYDYSNSRGPAGRWFSIGLANRKNHISLYSMAINEGRYLAEAWKDRFPGAKSGRSCLNIDAPERIPDEAVAQLAHESWAHFKGGFSRPPRDC